MKTALSSIKIKHTIYNQDDVVYCSSMVHPVALSNVTYTLDTIYYVDNPDEEPYHELVLKRKVGSKEEPWSWEAKYDGYAYTGLSEIEHTKCNEYYKDSKLYFYAPLTSLRKDLDAPKFRMERVAQAQEDSTDAESEVDSLI